MKKFIPIAALLLALISFPGCSFGTLTVGKNVKTADITEFYYTVDSSTFPPEYQRYRFYAEDGKYFFYHETRDGDHWPLTEDDITIFGTHELTAEESSAFFELLSGGTVTGRTDSAESGGRGPWLYIYWKGDKSKYQVYEFESYSKQQDFVSFCEELRDRTN